MLNGLQMNNRHINLQPSKLTNEEAVSFPPKILIITFAASWVKQALEM